MRQRDGKCDLQLFLFVCLFLFGWDFLGGKGGGVFFFFNLYFAAHHNYLNRSVPGIHLARFRDAEQP